MVVSRLSTLQSLSTDIRAQKWYCFIKKMFILNWRGNVNEVLYQPSHDVLLFICVVSLACDLERLAFTSRGVILSAHLGGGQPDISGCFKRNGSIAFFYEVCGLRFVQKTKGKIPHQRGKNTTILYVNPCFF